jgi:hypothetical protein
MPKTVAIVGASADRRKFGNKAVRAFQAQGYTVVPIHPRLTEVEGLKAYPSVVDVPGPIDMASVYVHPEIGLTLLAGFAALYEHWIGRDNARLQRRSERLQRKIDRLEKELEAARRVANRQPRPSRKARPSASRRS